MTIFVRPFLVEVHDDHIYIYIFGSSVSRISAGGDPDVFSGFGARMFFSLLVGAARRISTSSQCNEPACIATSTTYKDGVVHTN
jgi:hypothetical protein